MIEIRTDGGCWPNPGGLATYGVWVKDLKKTLWDGSGIVGIGPAMSNNVAEYQAFIVALEWVISNGMQEEVIQLFADSSLVIDQMTGKRGISGGLYMPYYLKARSLKFGFPHLSLQWIPRETNTIADDLAYRAFREYRKKHPEFNPKGMMKKSQEQRRLVENSTPRNIRKQLWSDFTADMPDGAAMAAMEEFGLGVEDFE